ncbi:MAG TPA: PQQ-binding-like beta-propeller repeat protein [Miltoncostaeaceae bacterium]|nr:PQQ-binding-like beta-propeller repeat protein [Miltoncostaeaceae bacterium]
MRRPSLAAFAAVLAGAGVVAGCGGGGGGGATTAPAPAPKGGVEVRVLDGDTQAPIAGARVRAFAPSGPLGGPVVADSAGRATVPGGATIVRARARGYDPASANVASDAATVRIFDPSIQSPQYGADSTRTRFVQGLPLPPPKGKPAWTHGGKVLLEFPPSVANGLVVLPTNRGKVFAIEAATGRKRWTVRQTASSYIAATPAIAGGRVYVASMDGRLSAYRATDGAKIWEFSTGGSPIESSPLVVNDKVYFGAWNGKLYAVSLRTAKLLWTFQASGQIKGSAAQAGDLIVFGDYAGNVYGVRRSNGSAAWRTSAGRRFYGGPGVSGNTVVIGDVGGAVVGLNAQTGARKWRVSTGGSFVYASPAIARGTAYIGAYNGRLYALDVASGRQRWSFSAGGPISGSATVVGGIVYTAVLAPSVSGDRTWGLDTRSGAVRFQTDDGRYSPVVAAGRTVYLVGRTTLYAYPAP